MSDVFIDIGDEAKKQIEGLVTELLNAVDAVKQFNTEFKRVKVPSDAQKAIDKTTASIKTQNKAIDQAEKITKKLIATKEKERLAEIQLQKQRENAFDKFEKNIKKEEQLKEKAKQQAEKLAAQEVKASERKRLAELKLQADREKAFDKFESNLQKSEQARQREANAIEKAKQREAAASEKAAKAAEKEKQKNTELNRSYNKLTAALNKAEKEYKDLAASQGLNSKATITAQKNVQKLRGQIDAINQPIKRFSDNVGNYPKTLGGGIKAIAKLGGAFVGAFGLIEGLKLAFNFAKESRELALQAKGVEFAFDRLGTRGEKAFNDIKKQTRGLLSDLDIKTSINEFENFGISLEESGTLFEFLSVRASQTGKSVDKLRDSLVEGLSKESKLRIDNLGISTAALNAELKKTPNFVQAVANIAKREVAKAGNILDSAAK